MKDEMTREDMIFALNQLRNDTIDLNKKKQSLIQKKEELDNNATEITTEVEDLFALVRKARQNLYSEEMNNSYKALAVNLLLLLILCLSSVSNYFFQMTVVLFPPGILLCINYHRKISKKEKNFDKNYEKAMTVIEELFIIYNDVMAKLKEIDQQIESISIQINQKESQISFITHIIETLDPIKEFNNEKEPVNGMTAALENEDEFTKENKQVKVKSKK